MEYILEVSDLIKQVDSFRLENVNFALEPGYIMGLIGPNGAGKSTLIQTILGLYRPTEGQIRICGFDTVEQEKAAKSRIGFVLEGNPFLEGLSAKDNARAYGRYYPEWDMQVFERYCRQFELNIKKPLKKLSKGNRMKFQLAFALSHNARLLVLDEPESGLDPVFRRDLTEILCDVISDGDRSILYSTHLTEELDRLADYITFLQNGKQIFSLSKEDLMDRYGLFRGSEALLKSLEPGIIVGRRTGDHITEALIRKDIVPVLPGLQLDNPSIEDIMYYSVQSL